MKHFGIALLMLTGLIEMTTSAGAQMFGGGTYYDRPPYNPYQYPNYEPHRARDNRHQHAQKDRCPPDYKLHDGVCKRYRGKRLYR